jgi:hypothetical protein
MYGGENMKKILFAIGLGLILTDCAGADPISLGVRAGADMANQAAPFPITGIKTDVLFGFTGGIFADFGLNDFLSLQPEANFTMKGIQLTEPPVPEINQYGQVVGYIGGSNTFSLNYFEIPLLLKAHAPLGPQIIGSLSAGPSLGMLLSANNHYSFLQGGSGNEALNAAGLDWGIMFGAGIDLDRFLLDVRYDLGLSAVYQDFFKGATNSVLSLEVGYRIL